MVKAEEYSKIRQIFSDIDEVEICRNRGKAFRFPIYLTDKLANTDIDVLELGVRSQNCLKRAGIYKIGDLCERIHTSSDLLRLRNCGITSVSEIMDSLFAYQYSLLSEKRKGQFLAKIIEMNAI